MIAPAAARQNSPSGYRGDWHLHARCQRTVSRHASRPAARQRRAGEFSKEKSAGMRVCARFVPDRCCSGTSGRSGENGRTITYKESTGGQIPIPSLATMFSSTYKLPLPCFCSILFQFHNTWLAGVCLNEGAERGRSRPKDHPLMTARLGPRARLPLATRKDLLLRTLCAEPRAGPKSEMTNRQLGFLPVLAPQGAAGV